MRLTVDAKIERWRVDGAFVISRGAKTHADVVVCEVSGGGAMGRSEATPIYYEGETAEQCVRDITQFAAEHIEFDRATVSQKMRRGAARNALDCALWDWQCTRSNRSLHQIADLPAPRPLVSAFTLSLDRPERMEQVARSASESGHHLLKLKLSGDQDLDRVSAVRSGAPNAKLIVDANESWNDLDIESEAGALKDYGVELIEQPVSAGRDHLLAGVCSPIPICADESCHNSTDVERIAAYYQAINIKLDKAGGLTEAIAMARAARALNLKILVGCMLSTSLGIRPAFALAQLADWIDLDGPLLLEKDREVGFRFRDGRIFPPKRVG